MGVSFVKDFIVKVSVVNASNNRCIAGSVMASLACDPVRVQQRFSPQPLPFQRVKLTQYISRSISYAPVTFGSLVRIDGDNALQAGQ